MKVVFAATHSSNAGAQLMWMNLAEEFASRGHDVKAVAFYRKDKNAAATPAGMKWTQILGGPMTTGRDRLRLLARLKSSLQEFSPDVIFTCMPLTAILYAIYIPLFSRKTHLVVCHHTLAGNYSSLMRRISQLLNQRWLRDRVVYVSEAVRVTFEGEGQARNADSVVIRNALPAYIESLLDDLAAERTARIAKEKSNGASDMRPLVLVATGHLRVEKNYPLLLKALARTDDVILKVVGRGIDSDDIFELVKQLEIEDKVEFLGFLPREKTLKIVAEADVFVQPSLVEGHSLAVVEAAKLGLPILVSDIAPQIEAVTDRNGQLCGGVIGVNDVDGWAAALNHLAANRKELEAMGAQSKLLGEEFRFSDVADRYEKLAREVVQESGPTARTIRQRV